MSARFSLDEPRLKRYTEPSVKHLVRLQSITFSSVVQVSVPIAILVLCIGILFNINKNYIVHTGHPRSINNNKTGNI